MVFLGRKEMERTFIMMMESKGRGLLFVETGKHAQDVHIAGQGKLDWSNRSDWKEDMTKSEVITQTQKMSYF